MLKLAVTSLILINPSPSNVKLKTLKSPLRPHKPSKLIVPNLWDKLTKYTKRFQKFFIKFFGHFCFVRTQVSTFFHFYLMCQNFRINIERPLSSLGNHCAAFGNASPFTLVSLLLFFWRNNCKFSIFWYNIFFEPPLSQAGTRKD